MKYLTIALTIIFIVILYMYLKTNPIPDHMPRQTSEQTEVILYYATWCSWSKKVLPEWKKFQKICTNKYPFIKTISVKCDEGDQCKDVPGFPTIMIDNGIKRYMYEGKRTSNDLINHCLSN